MEAEFRKMLKSLYFLWNGSNKIRLQKIEIPNIDIKVDIWLLFGNVILE